MYLDVIGALRTFGVPYPVDLHCECRSISASNASISSQYEELRSQSNPQSVVPSRPSAARSPPRAHSAPVGAPPTFIVIPKQLSFWGNYNYGDCVTAEEAFAKACSNPETFITEDDVIAWATRHGVLNGAGLTPVMTWMQTDGFPSGDVTYDDGSYSAVEWTNAYALQSAIFQGPVKLCIAGTSSTPPGSRPTASPAGSRPDITRTPATTTAPRCAVTDPSPGWPGSSASRSRPGSTERRRATRCSPGIPSGSSTCPR